jgi:hypothetical protein
MVPLLAGTAGPFFSSNLFFAGTKHRYLPPCSTCDERTNLARSAHLPRNVSFWARLDCWSIFAFV